MTKIRFALLLLAVAILAGCAPQAAPAVPDSSAANETQMVAEIAHHRMEIGRLQTGAYTTNVLVDLELPRGVRWTVLEFAEDTYVLRFTNDEVPDLLWLVDPAGVRTRSAE